MSVREGSAALRFRLKICLTAAPVLSGLPLELAALTLDLREGATEISRNVLALHHMSLAVCVVIGVIVFGVMGYSLFAHRRSRHPTPARFHENTRLEVVWTVIPALIVAGMAIPATVVLVDIEDSSDPELSVLVTGSQWKWHYEYIDSEIGFFSNPTTSTDQINNLEPKGDNYLLTVDNRLVLPVGRKVRFLMTSDDVIHSWWVPDFAVKQDAIPGFINEAWARIDEPGVYRGQCTELCGMNHAYMPVVVEARPAEEFEQWLEDQRVAQDLASEEAVEARNREWTMDELMPMGEEVYLTHCSTCHQPDGSGQGTKYPALAGGEIATGDLEMHLDTVMNGVADTEMQAWAPQLSDVDLAAVITYERNSWDNDTGDVVQPLTVYEAR